RRVVYLATIALVMLDTLRRIFGDSRPVDLLMLVIEFLVLAIIAGELIYVVIRHFRKQRITKRLFLMFLEGQTLQDAAPVRTFGPNDPEVADWKKRVGSWVSDVTVFLNQKCSRQAAISFRHYVTK